MSWNVAGLKKMTRNPDFCSFIAEFDIVFLMETFIEAKDLAAERNVAAFKDFKTWWTPAERLRKAGRASGGKVLCVKCEVAESVRYKKFNNVDFLEVFLPRKFVFVPVYLSGSEWDIGYNSLCRVIEGFQGREIVIIGDFNCRIGKKNSIPSVYLEGSVKNKARKSADKVVNSNGRRRT